MAVGVDANDQLFPLAFAIVEGNNDSWGWFMACIRMRVTQQPDPCVISDLHRNIIAAMNDDHLGWGPRHAHHRFYVHHLASNFHSRFRDKSLKTLVVRAAYERQTRKFDYQMERVARINQDDHALLCSISVDKWALLDTGKNMYA